MEPANLDMTHSHSAYRNAKYMFGNDNVVNVMQMCRTINSPFGTLVQDLSNTGPHPLMGLMYALKLINYGFNKSIPSSLSKV